MDNQEKKELKNKLHIAYEIYHFVAKVFLYSILLILILVAVGFAAYSVDLLHNIKTGTAKSPLLGAYIVVTPSMVPTINVEDAIIVLRKEPEEFKIRDIITFNSSDPRYSGLTITHRIVGIERMTNGELYFRTKGDNNNVEDATLVPATNVYGKVILKIPLIGYVQYILMQAYGWIILVVIPCLGVVIYDIYKIIMSVNGKRIDLVQRKKAEKEEETKEKSDSEII